MKRILVGEIISTSLLVEYQLYLNVSRTRLLIDSPTLNKRRDRLSAYATHPRAVSAAARGGVKEEGAQSTGPSPAGCAGGPRRRTRTRARARVDCTRRPRSPGVYRKQDALMNRGGAGAQSSGATTSTAACKPLRRRTAGSTSSRCRWSSSRSRPCSSRNTSCLGSSWCLRWVLSVLSERRRAGE